MHIAAIDTVSSQIAVAVGRPGKIDGAGCRIGHRDQPLGNSRRKSVVGRHLDGLARQSLDLHRSPGKVERCDSFDHIAVALVEERGGIDRMARVFAVRGRGLRASAQQAARRARAESCEPRRGRGGQLQALDAEEYGSSGLGGGLPAEQDTILPHLAGQPGERAGLAPAAL